MGGQRLGLPLVRADPAEPSAEAHERALVEQAVAEPKDALVTDRGFGVRLLQEEGATADVARVAKNFTARRAQPPAYGGRGRPAKRGEVVLPLARSHRQRELAATPPDRVQTWQEGETVVRAEQWDDPVLPELALLAGSVLSYAAATGPAVPTGCWDRRPQPSGGRLRRVPARVGFPADFPFPARIRDKAALTNHLPKGYWGQRRRNKTKSAASRGLNQPPELTKAA